MLVRCAALAALTLFTTTARAEDAPPDWGAAARQDIEAAVAIYRVDHAGWDNPSDPGFRDQLAAARAAGLARAETADSEADYIRALGAFSAELGDGHARIFRSAPSGGVAGGGQTWPGFVPAFRGNGVFVHSAAADFPFPAGTRITACDGMPIRVWIREHGLESGLRPAEQGQWWSRTPAMMTGRSDARPPAATCAFVDADGAAAERPLAWTAAPVDLADRRLRASDGERLPIGLSEPAAGVFWIALPDFAPDAAGAEAYDRLYAELADKRDALGQARAVVVDLRHNNGGSSTWSERVAKALWGDKAVERRSFDRFAGVTVWYRASAANTAYVDSWRQLFKDDRETAEQVRQVADGMHAALAAGDPYHVVRDSAEDVADAVAKSPRTDFTAPVYVIAPGRCASACLDALDTFTLFDNVSLIGAPTSGDSIYLEVRQEPLPSGQGRIVIPIKFWHQRPRESGEVYHPRIRVDALDWSTATFLEVVERDLGRSK
jgi:hypothetical protein